MVFDSYDCPKCGRKGSVKMIVLGYAPIETTIWKFGRGVKICGTILAWRWTCEHCKRDFGYNTDRPIFIPGAVKIK